MDASQKEVHDLLRELGSSKEGLSQEEAKSRLKKYGYNDLEKQKEISLINVMLSQVKNILIGVLLIAVIISFLFKQYIDAGIILAIIFLNMIIGTMQEYKAEHAMQALQKLTKPEARVIRKGMLQTIPTREIVPGDILLIEEGSFIPADARIIEAHELTVNESTLTGESIPINKTEEAVKKMVSLAEQNNMLFAGTSSITGRAKAIVVNTGLRSEWGKIAKEIQSAPEKQTSFQKELKTLGKQISMIIIGISLLIFFISLVRNISSVDAFLSAVALAVAAIPEGLPAVITITLALGTQRMSKAHALIRKLPAIESMGAITVICADKTGTMTKNEMTVTRIETVNKSIMVTGTGFQTKGDLQENNKPLSMRTKKELFHLFACADLCNNAADDFKNIIDPTEAALKALVKKAKFSLPANRLKEFPFTSEKKYMAVLCEHNKNKTLYMKGALESVLHRSSYIQNGGKVRKLTKQDQKHILKKEKELASSALRVLAYAYANHGEIKDLIFLGMTGMIDPPRDCVKEAIQQAEQAGMRVVMITGDHEETARAIAKQIGIRGDVLTGKEIDSLSMRELEKTCGTVGVYARVNPLHKVKILEALQRKGQRVLMTGDGVNDAPALKRADVGVAVGAGTDVAKQAADMILADNDFSSIIKAIGEGRRIFANMRKFLNYLFTSNVAEVMVVSFFSFVGVQAISAAQLLWINLLTDGLPALALGIDPAEKNIMQQKPRSPKEPLLNSFLKKNILVIGIIKSLLLIALFFYVWKTESLLLAQTMVFTGLVFFEILRIVAIRSTEKISWFANKWLWLAMFISLGLQVLILYTPLQKFFNVTVLGLQEWMLLSGVLGIGLLLTIGMTKLLAKVSHS